MLKIGVIGCGGRMTSIVQRLTDSGKIKLAAVMDTANENARKRIEEELGITDVNYYDNAETMLQKENLDGVCIGTRCSTHTPYAVLVSKYNIPMFLEKPVGISDNDISQLKTILPKMDDKVVVSFPLRLTRMVTYVKDLIENGLIGTVEHVQAYNNVNYGRGYYHKWYRDESITGGLFLQKATHDLDYINYLLGGIKPVRLCAMKSKQIFKGNKPAGLLCENCDEQKTCTESPENVKKNGDGFIIGKYCCFAEDTGNEDSGSVIIEYDSGMHVVYSQNFIVRNGAGKRGARLIGYKGTIEFDWFTGEITVYKHLENVIQKHTFPNAQNRDHFGGDQALAENFIEVMKGTEKSLAPLSEGILSAELCLAAKKSSIEHRFYDL